MVAATSSIGTFMAKYDINGRPILDNSRTFDDEIHHRIQLSRALRSHYQWELNALPNKKKFNLGIAPLTAIIEVIWATIIAIRSFSVATALNDLTSVAELGETIASGTDIMASKEEKRLQAELDSTTDPNRRVELENELDAARAAKGTGIFDINGHGSSVKSELAIGSVQAVSGLLGLGQIAVSKLMGSDTDENHSSIFEKMILSIGAAFCSLMMIFSAGEKSLISSLLEHRGLEHPSFTYSGAIDENAGSDSRCAGEWALIPIFLFFRDFKITNFLNVRDIFDAGISFKAIWEGAKPIIQFKKEHHERAQEKESLMRSIFSTESTAKWYIKRRNDFFAPFLRRMGCKPLDVHLEDDKTVTCKLKAENTYAQSL